jgi:hypothetical protein
MPEIIHYNQRTYILLTTHIHTTTSTPLTLFQPVAKQPHIHVYRYAARELLTNVQETPQQHGVSYNQSALTYTILTAIQLQGSWPKP